MTTHYRAEGDLAVLTIDDGKVNAMGPRFFEALNRALDRQSNPRPTALPPGAPIGIPSAEAESRAQHSRSGGRSDSDPKWGERSHARTCFFRR